ncbi:intradiol ring-cleavage dioxygenase [Rhizobium sp. EC-SD404]|uniref:dioxygenase family protein n=1 Tax=Rhizobium sp. EC-SD404 TaxID=2038389 RepID=UPI00125AD310|nr:intradiol ring-cleavage dioxygenase [Rhizobium sp. EC-SD404]VVT15860.1 Intradiol ring-cleavage dioxygenase protein [Rhizobium sp. EC-SD404]
MVTAFSRRAFLNAWVAAPMSLALAGGASAQGAPLPSTPACGPDDDVTPAQTEGPFYTPETPERRDFRSDGAGTPVTVFGFVVDPACRPRANMIVDVWHADDAGTYDNSGYAFRGYQVTDGNGRFIFETIVPGRYPGRTRHYHVRIASSAGVHLTTQLYFPGEPDNDRDGIYDPRLLMDLSEASDGLLGRFDFVLA